MKQKWHIVIDAEIISGKSPLTGLGVYVDRLVTAMAVSAPEYFHFTLLYHGDQWRGKDYGPRFKTVGYGAKHRHSTAIFFQLPQILKSLKADLYHVTCTTGGMPFLPCPVLTTVHDIYPLLDRIHNRWKSRFLFRLLFFATRLGSDHFLCNSRFTLKELQKAYPRLENTVLSFSHLAPGNDFSNRSAEINNGPGHEKILFCAGALEHRKGQDLLLAGYLKALQQNPELPDLCFAGPDRGLGQLIRSCGCTKVHWLKYLPDGEFERVMQNAVCCIFPSRYEGFGIPLLEAMSAGKTVICSDIEVFREIGGELPLYTALDADAFAEKILCCFRTGKPPETDPDRIKQHLSRFSWRKNAEDTLQLYQKLLKININIQK